MSRQFSQGNVTATFGLVEGNSSIIAPGFLTALTYQLSQHTACSLQWKAGVDSFMKGGIHYDNQRLAVSSVVQVRFIVLMLVFLKSSNLLSTAWDNQYIWKY